MPKGKPKVERTPNFRPSGDDCRVTLKETGNVLEVRYVLKEQGGNIKKIDKDFYEVVIGRDDNGDDIIEVREFSNEAKTRADNLTTVAQSMRNLRDIINANVTEPEKCLWVTLTYRENMWNTMRLYTDMDKFVKRLRYYLSQNNMPEVEYINCVEPQSRGAWHCHAILIFPHAKKAPFIPNAELAAIWGHGFTKTKSLSNIENPGLYLTAYLTDMEFSEISGLKISGNGLKEIAATDEDGKPLSKAIVKGARLKLYPAGMRIFRTSRNVKRPAIVDCTEGEAMKIVGDAPLTFERSIRIGAGDSTFNRINYRQYNRMVKPDDNNANGENDHE